MEGDYMNEQLIKALDESEIEEIAVIVGCNDEKNRSELHLDYMMNELEELVKAAGARVVGRTTQNRKVIEAATYIGKGKAEEIRELCHYHGANLVIFNNELSGAQIRNLEAIIEVKVIDRTALILDIFAKRAKSKVSKLQVELAQLKYSLPRLTGLGVSLSRTGGGIGTRGPGEQKLEIDRRRIHDKITDIRRELDEAVRVRETQRALRIKNQTPVVAIVGYTNAGKSTLMNTLIKHSVDGDDDKHVFVKDMLFATLDTYSRRIRLEDNKEFILVDTVGFVSHLPHSLVQAFKATLEEVVEADLLLHVVDVTNEDCENQIQITEEVLREIGVENKPSLYVFNKIDRLEEGAASLFQHHDSVQISALNGLGLPELIERVKNHVFKNLKRVKLCIPYDKGSYVSDIMARCHVLNHEYDEVGTLIEVELDQRDLTRYSTYLLDPIDSERVEEE